MSRERYSRCRQIEKNGCGYGIIQREETKAERDDGNEEGEGGIGEEKKRRAEGNEKWRGTERRGGGGDNSGKGSITRGRRVGEGEKKGRRRG